MMAIALLLRRRLTLMRPAESLRLYAGANHAACWGLPAIATILPLAYGLFGSDDMVPNLRCFWSNSSPAQLRQASLSYMSRIFGMIVDTLHCEDCEYDTRL